MRRAWEGKRKGGRGAELLNKLELVAHAHISRSTHTKSLGAEPTTLQLLTAAGVCVEGGWRLKIRDRWCEALLWLSRRPSALIALPEERPRRRGYPHRQAAPVPTEHRHTSASSPAAFLTHSHTRIPIHWLSPICVFCCFILTTNFFLTALQCQPSLLLLLHLLLTEG